MQSVEIRIYGRVQGVGFRFAAKKKADELGLFGFVQNETDGSVQLAVQGDDKAVELMIAWIKHGPFFANIEKVITSQTKPMHLTDFTIVR